MVLKRLFDGIFASTGLIVLSPVFIVLSLMVMFSMGRPVLFRQPRAGLYGREFTLAKFRSMRDAYDTFGAPLPDAVRMTAIGRILRRFRLDELPEFWMIATGDMSFVGPRPLPRILIEAESMLQARCQVRPGLTGLAQVSGNTLLTNSEKFAVDLYYVDQLSLLGDLKIILKTILMIVGGERRNEPLIRKALQYASSVNRRGR